MNDIAIVRTYAATDDARVLVEELEAALAADYPPEQRHGLTFDAIFQPHVRFFVASIDGAPAGCGGVAIFADFAEVKRMYVRPALRGRGIAQALLARIEAETRAAGCRVLRLETGIRQPAAIRVYERAGFVRCAAFGDYRDLPQEAIATSLFYEKKMR